MDFGWACMPHKSRRNIFEEHIESDDFDVSRLGLTYGMSDLSSPNHGIAGAVAAPL